MLARDEGSAPYGETLAHACAYYGATPLLARLLETSSAADLARRRGLASGFTALHAAVAGGHLEACKLLLDAGARTATASAARRSILWKACVKGHREVRDAAAPMPAGCNPMRCRLQPYALQAATLCAAQPDMCARVRWRCCCTRREQTRTRRRRGGSQPSTRCGASGAGSSSSLAYPQ